jgi:hypothetical protein
MMRRAVVLVLAAALLLVLPAASAPNVATLAVASSSATSVSYAVTFTAHSGQYSLWVANLCLDAAGVTVTAAYLPIVWKGPAGTAGPFATDGSNPSTGPVVGCRAYVWKFPDAWTPVSNTVEITA